MNDVGLGTSHVGMAGEFRFVVTRADGTIKEDTGFQRNLILNQGLDFFGGGNGADMLAFCVIGVGNSEPTATQTALSSYTAVAPLIASAITMKYNYTDDGSGLYKCNRVGKYSFTTLSNVNISEVGLASVSSGSTYYLCTRALLKDSLGSATSITILAGEILDVYYKLWKVVSIADVSYVVNMTDGKGGSVPYNTRVRLANVGDIRWGDGIGKALIVDKFNIAMSTAESTAITSMPATSSYSPSTSTVAAYVNGTYKRVVTYNFGVNDSNAAIRNLVSFMSNDIYANKLTYFQIRYGSVTGDNAILKTNLQKMELPLEYSWGRYEGAL